MSDYPYRRSFYGLPNGPLIGTFERGSALPSNCVGSLRQCATRSKGSKAWRNASAS